MTKIKFHIYNINSDQVDLMSDQMNIFMNNNKRLSNVHKNSPIVTNYKILDLRFRDSDGIIHNN